MALVGGWRTVKCEYFDGDRMDETFKVRYGYEHKPTGTMLQI
jgi:hypothetical protein